MFLSYLVVSHIGNDFIHSWLLPRRSCPSIPFRATYSPFVFHRYSVFRFLVTGLSPWFFAQTIIVFLTASVTVLQRNYAYLEIAHLKSSLAQASHINPRILSILEEYPKFPYILLLVYAYAIRLQQKIRICLHTLE